MPPDWMRLLRSLTLILDLLLQLGKWRKLPAILDERRRVEPRLVGQGTWGVEGKRIVAHGRLLLLGLLVLHGKLRDVRCDNSRRRPKVRWEEVWGSAGQRAAVDRRLR